MKIQEIEQVLDFMASIGYSNRDGALMLSKYFNARANGYTAEQAASIIFTEYESALNKELDLTEKIKAFHKRLCKIDGYKPEMISDAIEDFYKIGK